MMFQPGQPDTGVRQLRGRNASSGVPTFIMIFTGMSGIDSITVSWTVNSSGLVDEAGVALGAETVDLRPADSSRVALPVPTTAGMPARAIVAA